MKVCIFSGSNNTKNSNCKYVATRLSEKLQAIGFSVNTYLASSCKLQYCEGCLCCFYGKPCEIEDDFLSIQNDFSQSDAIILISPVYAHSVSASMKCLIDRCSYMMHLMPFAGKAGVSISISSDNGNQFVTDYLNKVLHYWGVSVIETVALQNATMDTTVQNSYLDHVVDRLRYFERHRNLRANETQEKIFQIYNQKYIANPMTAEAKIWMSQGYSMHTKFQEILDLKLR